MSSENTSPSLGEQEFSDVQPLCVPLVFSPSSVCVSARDASQAHFFCVRSQRYRSTFSSAVAICQPWFYRRLVAYGFVGLSEGAYGGRCDWWPNPPRILTLEPLRSAAGEPN